MKLKTKNISKIEEKIKIAYDVLDVNQINKIFKSKKTFTIIDILNQISDPHIIIFCIIVLQKDKQLRLINSIDFDIQKEILSSASDSQLKLILKDLYSDQIVSLIDQHPEYEKRIYLSVDKDTRKEISTLSSYEEDEIGRIMNPEPLYVIDSWTVNKAIKYIKEEYKELETTTTIFVVDSEKKLLGIISIHDLFFAPKQSVKISTIMNTDFYSIQATDDIEDIINMFDKYSLSSSPVVDSKNTLLGFVRNIDINAIAQDETTEDIYKLYGITELKDPYFHASIWSVAKSRLLWLTILMVAATLTSVVLDLFQGLGESWVAGLSSILLVPLIPVLTGTSGNAGSQSAASIIRSLSLGEITKVDYWKAIFKEFRVGLVVGGILSIINFVRLLIYYAATFSTMKIPGINGIYVEGGELYWRLVIISLATSITLFITIILSKTLGSTLPIIAIKLKKDPAVMSSPVLATILDVLTSTLLFGIGIVIIHFSFPF